MKAGVYKITNNISGKIYVGSSVDLNKRMRRHRYLLSKGNHVNRHLQDSWVKHGESSFTFSIILYCAKENALWYEQRAIDALAPEFNMLPNARSALGAKRSENTRKLLSEAAKMSWQLEEHRERKLAAICTPEYKIRRFAIDASETTREARSQAARLAMSRPDVKERHRLALIAAYASPAIRETSSAKQKIAQSRPEVIAKKSAAMKEAYSSPEAKKRISESAKKVWSDTEYRKLHTERLRAAVRTESARRNNSLAITSKWSDPEYRAKNCKFSDEEILLMLRMRRAGESLASIAAKFKADKGTVGKICAGTVYKWVDRTLI